MNILLINADQLRHDCVGWRGIRPVRTPNLDALADESVVFKEAYTPLPVCSPARQALLTGRRPDAIGAQWNYDFMPTPTLDPTLCFPPQLRDAGWNTGYIGRFHLAPDRKPSDYGYERFVLRSEYNRFAAEKYPDAEFPGGWLGCSSPIPLEDSAPFWLADRAGEMISDFAAAGKPWHLWIDFEEPHLPVRPSAPYDTMYDPAEIKPWDGFGDDFAGKPYIHKQQTLSWATDALTWDDFAPMVARYYGVISQLDEAIGRILQRVRDCGQWDETMIVFTSDHGDMCGSHQMLDKHYVLYDDIIRVPLMWKAPGVAHRTTDCFVMNVLDIAATIRACAGLPADALGHGIPLPCTPADEADRPNDVLVTSNGQQFGLYTTRALRTRTHKYVWNLTDTDELYDLIADPGEKRNLIHDPALATLVTSMRRRLNDRLTETGDRFVRSEWMKRQLLENRKL